MAILRTQSHLLSSAPPPSPIATGKGSRSAAIDDRILSEFLEKSLKVPDLNLPESYFPAKDPNRIPAEIDLASLLSRDEITIRRLLISAIDLGVFQIIGHGISAEELRLVMEEANEFRIRAERKMGLRRNLVRMNNNWEDFCWYRSRKGMMEKLLEEVWPERCRTFSEKMENIFIQLESVAKIVIQMLSENATKQWQKTTPETESILCLHKYSGDLFADKPQDRNEGSSHALSLLLFCKEVEFHVQSRQGSLSFNTAISAIVVTIGKQLQEWSKGEFESVIGEPIFEAGINGNPSYNLEFMYSPSLNQKFNHVKTISLIDQMLMMLAVAFIYNFLAYISKRIGET
ncbi:2-oxoglutarate (2OG) and Fe(II)-dependent oxygenase superfamily protein [Tasmannia lanceolata]|uniref:2-oxoglutarate (2OG) and Fe(II)-dependent oxygenase superfamily protein n=1 Tax=Tasmannia lanceolata TaxID=3420 RepID=UPI0040632779